MIVFLSVLQVIAIRLKPCSINDSSKGVPLPKMKAFRSSNIIMSIEFKIPLMYFIDT